MLADACELCSCLEGKDFGFRSMTRNFLHIQILNTDVINLTSVTYL